MSNQPIEGIGSSISQHSLISGTARNFLHLSAHHSEVLFIEPPKPDNSCKKNKIFKIVGDILELQKLTTMDQVVIERSHEWQKSLRAEDKQITSVWQNLLKWEEVEKEGDLKVSFEQIDTYLEAFEQQILSFDNSNTNATKDAHKMILHSRQTMMASKILMQCRENESHFENAQINLHLQLDAFRAGVIDYNIDAYPEIVRQAQFLSDAYQEAALLPSELRKPLVEQIRTDLKIIFDLQIEFQQMRKDIYAKISKTQMQVKEVNDRLCAPTKMNTKGIIDTYKQLEQGKATLRFLQSKIVKAEEALSKLAPFSSEEDSLSTFNKVIETLSGIPKGFITAGKETAEFGLDVVKAFTSVGTSLIPSIDKKVCDDEKRMIRDLINIRKNLSKEAKAFAEMSQQNETLLDDQTGSDKFYDLLLSQNPNALRVLLSQPLVEFRDFSSDKLSQKDYLQAKKDLALTFILSDNLSKVPSSDIKKIVEDIKLRAIAFLNKKEIQIGENLYDSIAVQEDELDRLKKTEQWQELRLKEIEELEAGPSPGRIKALNLFFFLLHAGTWVKSASDMITQGMAMQQAHDVFLAKLRSEVSKEAEKTAGFIGTALSDRLNTLQHKTPEELRKFCKADSKKPKYPGAYEVLSEVLASRGNNTNPLTREEIFTIQETYLLSTLKSEEGAFKHMNFSNWLSLFFEKEKVSAAPEMSHESMSTEDAVLSDFPASHALEGQNLSFASHSIPLTVPANSLLANQHLSTLAFQSASVNQLHRFLTSPGPPVDVKIFAHLVGHANPMIEKGMSGGVKFEGLRPSKTIAYQLGIAEAMLQAVQQMPSSDQEMSSLCCGMILGDPSVAESVKNNPELLKDLIRQLRIAQHIEESFRKVEETFLNGETLNEEVFVAIAKEYRNQMVLNVEKLDPGQSFFFSGGWIHKEGESHILSWGVTKQMDGKLTVRLYNTGAGLEHHSSKKIGLGGHYYLPFIEIEDVDPKQFTSTSITQGIFNIRSTLVADGVIDWGSREVYSSIIIGMGGSLSSRQYSLSELTQPQYVGICAMESVMAAIGATLESETSSILYRFWSNFKGTVSYFDQEKDNLVSGEGSEERRRLLYDGIKVLSGLANKVQEAGALADAELDYTSKAIKLMNHHLKDVEKQINAEIVATEPIITFHVASEALQIIDPPEFNLDAFDKNSSVAIRKLVSIESEAFSANPATIVKDLKKLLQDIHVGNHDTRNYLEVQKAIRGIVLKIPLDTSFWSKIDDVGANELLTIFAEISKEFLWNLLNIDEISPKLKLVVASENYICQAKLLTLTDYVTQHFNNPLGLKIPSLYQDYLLKLTSRASPEWVDQEIMIKEYWQHSVQDLNRQNTIPTFFEFEFYPAGNTGDFYRRFNLNSDFSDPELNYINLHNRHEVPIKWLFSDPKDSNSVVNFIKQWLAQNPQKLQKIDPEQSLDDQVIDVLQHMDKLPTLRDAFLVSYAYDFLLTGPFHNPLNVEDGYDFSKGISIHVEQYEKKINEKKLTCSGMKYSLFGNSPIFQGTEEINIPSGLTSRWPLTVKHVKKASQLQKKELGLANYLHQIYTNYFHSRWRLDSNIAVTLNPGEKHFICNNIGCGTLEDLGISVEEFRELMALSSGSSVQIDQTIGYFTEHTNQLIKPTYQIFFRLLMTESDLLSVHITESHQAAAEIASIYKNMLNSAQISGEINLIIFLAGMSSRLEEVYESEKRKNPELFTTITVPDFVDSRAILTHLSQSVELADEQRTLASRELVLSFRKQNTITPEEAIQLIYAAIYMHTHELPKDYKNDYFAAHEVDLLVRDYFTPQLRDLFQGEYRDQILSKVLKMLTDTAVVVGEWTSPNNFPHFISPDGIYHLDVLEGNLKVFSGKLTPFDHSLLQNQFMEHVFGNEPPRTMVRIDDKTIYMKSKTGDSYQLKGHQNIYSATLQRQFRGDWYELQDRSFSSKIRNLSLISGMDVWYKPLGIEGTLNTLILTDQVTKKERYHAVLSIESNGTWWIQKIIKLDDQERDTGLVLINSEREELSIFRRLEVPEYIMAWSKEGRIKQVELPRFGLTFTIKQINGREQAVSEDLSGFVLLEGSKQHISELGNIRHYLHLQRVESDGSISEKVIFAMLPLKPYTQGSYLTDAVPDTNTINPLQERIEYQLLKGELVPTSTNEQEIIEANLFLAMTHLAERHAINPNIDANPYQRANHYLEKANTQILLQREGLSPSILKILSWIATQDSITMDKHPDANVLRLKAGVILLRNKLDFLKKPSNEDVEELNASLDPYESLKSSKIAYVNYLTHLNYVDANLRLTEGEELALLNNFGIEDSRLAYRLQQLSRGADPTQDSHILQQDPIEIQSFLKDTIVYPTNWINGFEKKIMVEYITKTENYSFKKWMNEISNPLSEPNLVHKGVYLRDIKAYQNFVVYYAILRGDVEFGPAIISNLNKGMGLTLDTSLSRVEMLQEVRTALKMTFLSNSYQDDLQLILILLAVATHPEKFLFSAEDTWKMLSEFRTAVIMKYTNQKDAAVNQDDKLRIEDPEKTILEIKSAFKENFQVPAEDLRDQKALNLTVSKSLQIGLESNRLRREKELAKQNNISQYKDLTFSECINLDAETGLPLSNRSLTHPIIPQQAMEQILRTVSAPQQKTEEATAVPLFQGVPKNPRIGELFAAAEMDLAIYTSKSLENPNYEVVNHEKTIELCQILQQNVTVLQKELSEQEVNLLQFANRGPSRIGELSARDLQIEQGSLKLLTLDELNRAFFQRDLEILHKRNPNLSREGMTELFGKIENYLLDATHLQHEKRVLKKAEAMKKSIESNQGGFAFQENIRAFVDTVASTRAYEVKEHPEYLVFEYYADILMWNLQVETLEAFGKKELRGALIELAMSLGKSSVIAPLLTWLEADGDKIASILTPEPLLSSMAKDLQETSGRVFAQKTRSIAIKREPITSARLQRLLDNLDQVRRERIALVWSASDILSLFNQWIELNEQAFEMQAAGVLSPEKMRELSDKRILFLKNFKLLQDCASFTVDEIHKVFDITQSHSFTFGAPNSVHSDITSGVVILINAIISNKELFETIHWEFLEKSKGESFTEEGYHEKVKGKLVNTLIDSGIALDKSEYRDFFGRLSESEKQQLKAYLSATIHKGVVKENLNNLLRDISITKADLEVPEYYEKIALVYDPDALKGYKLLSNLEMSKGVDPVYAKKIRNEFATLKELINHILPQTAGKKALVHFGEDANEELIVPYHDGVPTKNSLFGSVLERLIYTAQYGLAQGVSVDIVRKKIQQLMDNYEADRALGRNPDLSEFNRLVGGNKDQEFSLLKFNNKEYAEKKYEEILKIVNQNPEIVLQLIVEFRLPKIKVYAKEIDSSAHIIPLLAKEEQGVRGMSGTLFNVPTFPKIFQSTKLSDTQAKTLHILKKNSAERVVTLPGLKTCTVEDKLEKIIAHEVEAATSLLDVSGSFSGLSNEAIARLMLDNLRAENSNIQGVVYYDGNTKKVITMKDRNPITYRADMDRESLAAFWDLSHITGSDIPLGQFMKANMIVGKHVTLVSLMQGAWRLRGLAKGQVINFMVPEEDKKIICKMLKEHLNIDVEENEDLTLSKLISFAYLNQALQESQNTYQGVKESMKVALIKQITKAAWNEKTGIEDALSIYNDTRSLFIKEETNEPWDRWGPPIEDAFSREALIKLLDDWQNNPIIAKIRANPELYNGVDLEALFVDWDEIIENITGPLPETVKVGAEIYGKITEQITEQQSQQQVAQKQQVALYPQQEYQYTLAL